MSEAEQDGSPAMLNGWKEIAAYLGKSVRSVQRWERDLGLPVRRINTPDRGQIIYASRAEIERWRQKLDRKAVSLEETDPAPRTENTPEPTATVAAIDVPPVAAPAPVVVAPSVVHEATRGPGVVPVALIAGAAVLAGLLLGRWSVNPGRVPARLEISGTTLVAFGGPGRSLWRHDLGEEVTRPDGPDGAPAFVDLDGDGRAEILVPVRFGAAIAGRVRSDEVVCLRSDGSVLWRAAPELSVMQQDRTIRGPWTFQSLVAPGAASGGRTWIAFTHQTRSPGLVLEVDPSGDSRLRFVQDGSTTSLAYWPVARGILAVGGALDVEERASVALVALDGPPVQAPTIDDRRLQCASCPVDGPAAFFVLPASEVARATGRLFTAVTSLSVSHAGLRVSTDDQQVGLIGSTLLFEALEYTDEHWAIHRLLEEHEKIDHPADRCQQRLTSREVRSWQPGTGWTAQGVMTEPVRAGRCP